MPQQVRSPINSTSRRDAGELSPGARSNPSRGDTSQLGNLPSVPRDEGEKPEPSLPPVGRSDAIGSAVEAHLQRHALLRCNYRD
jgi:hypothetical protein